MNGRTIASVMLAALAAGLTTTPLFAQRQASGGAGSLNATERRIAAAVDERNAQALALLERVVNINSGTQNFEGVREVGRVFRAEFDALGFTTRWVDGTAFKRAGHLVADHPGTGRRHHHRPGRDATTRAAPTGVR